jgi:hypothetical protein
MPAALNYTTKVPVQQSLAEAQERLAAAGADHIGVGYDNGLPTALTFRLRGPHGIRDFSIPVDVEAVQRLLVQQEKDGRFKSLRKAQGTYTSREHAAMVAWRIIKDWVAVQTTLVEASLIRLDEVMLPHLLVPIEGGGEQRLSDAYRAREDALALSAGSS